MNPNCKQPSKVYPPREGNDIWEGQQVISRPDVHTIQLTKADNFLILACDGVWDVLSNQEAVSYVHRRLLIHRDVQRAAVELVNKVKFDSLPKGERERGGGSTVGAYEYLIPYSLYLTPTKLWVISILPLPSKY